MRDGVLRLGLVFDVDRAPRPESLLQALEHRPERNGCDRQK
jgi:hypothetical protein